MPADALIETSSLNAKLKEPKLRLLDATAFLDLHPDKKSGFVPRSGRAEWEKEHIDGAQHVDLVSTFSNPLSPFPFMMPTPERFCSLVAELGVSEDDEVVIYSSGSMMWSTRLWWMFRSVGFNRCAVLNGGFAKWKAEGRPTTAVVNHYAPGKIQPQPSSLGWAKKSEIVEFLKSGGDACVIDALSPRDYSGEHSKYGGKGHIPGSHNLFYQQLLHEDGTLLPAEKLKELLAPSNALKSQRVICYCGGGIASTLTAISLYLCGHRNIAVYDGSMLEWASDKSLPLKLGSLP